MVAITAALHENIDELYISGAPVNGASIKLETQVESRLQGLARADRENAFS